VHSTYEDNMVDAHADQIAAGIGDAIANLTFKPRRIQTARDAAMAVMDLMNFCQQALPPEKICEVYNSARPGTHTSATKDKAVLDALWDQCGQATIEVIAAGAVALGAIWQAAWTLAGKPDSTPWLATTYDGTNDLMSIYENKQFLHSLHLQYLGQADLPGSDAPANPPTPPSGSVEGATDERGHRPKSTSGGKGQSAHRGTKTPVKGRSTKTPAKRAAKKATRPGK
jgi:hypothetical protein